jgi:uncharacterized protein YeaO (DUF488 family)
MSVRTYLIGSRRKPGEGLRIGAVRFLPRGVKKKDYARLDQFDVWLPLLAPSRKILEQFRKAKQTPAARDMLFARYEREMAANTDSRQAIELIAKLGRRAPIALGCYCADESACHRSVLLKLVRQAQKT